MNNALLTVLVCCGATVALAEEKKVVSTATKPATTQTKQVASTATPLKIGTWNMHENLAKNGSSKDKQAAITAIQTKEAKQLEDKRDKSAKRFEEFNAKKDMLSKDAREKEEKELMILSREFQMEAQKAQELVRAEVNKLTEELALEAETAAIEIAKSLDLDMLIEKNTGRVVYEKSSSYDITAKVAEKMDKNYEVKLAQNKKADEAVKVAAKAEDKTAVKA